MMDTYVVFDIETTGLNPVTDRILEIGAVKIKNGHKTDVFQELINPQVQIPYRIQELTGITQEMAEKGEDPRITLLSFLDFCEELPVLGHNIRFDYSFIKNKAVNEGKSFEKLGVDTLKIARKMLPELPSRSLEPLCRYYKIDPGNSHRALDDAVSTWRLYEHLREDFFNTEPKLFEPRELQYKVKKQSGITRAQKGYLKDLIKYHRIEQDIDIEALTKNEASRMIDHIILRHGRIRRDER